MPVLTVRGFKRRHDRAHFFSSIRASHGVHPTIRALVAFIAGCPCATTAIAISRRRGNLRDNEYTRVASVNVSNVLVVEDDIVVAENIATLLAVLKVQITIARTVRQARACVTNRAYDVAVLDLFLPDGNGVELMRELNDLSPMTELVIVTGNATLDSATAAIRGRVVDYLTKPFEGAHLVDSVRLALSRHSDDRAAHDERQREERIAALRTLANGLAHHLRNPLNSALLQLEVARRRDEATREHSLALAQSELFRLSDILRDFERCITPAEIRLDDTGMDELWSSVIDDVHDAALANQVVIGAEVAREASIIRVDCDLIRLALLQLARNAIEAMPKGGTLTFRARRSGSIVELELEDTGPGIADTGAIFDPFYTTKLSGTGLGLTIVHKTVIAHGGSIRVASRPGCTGFVISIPHAS